MRITRFSKIIRRTAIFLVTLAVLLTIGVTLLAQFDLNRWRPELEAELGELLGQPVSIGKIHLAFHEGLSIDLDRLDIGTPERNLHFRIPRLFVQLEIRPLLLGDLQFSKIHAESPSLTLSSPPSGHQEGGQSASADSPPSLPSLEEIEKALEGLHAEQLSVSNAAILWKRPQGDLRLERLNLNLAHWTADQAGYLSAYAFVPQKDAKARIQLKGEIPSLRDLSDWREANFLLNGQITDLQLGNQKGQLPCDTPCTLDRVSLNINGKPEEGLRLVVEAQIDQNGKDAPTVPARLKGRWRSSEDLEIFDQLAFTIADSEIAGEVHLEQEDGYRVKLKLTSDFFNLTWLQTVLPADLLSRLEGGSVQQFRLEADTPWPPVQEKGLAVVQALQGQFRFPRIHLRDKLYLEKVEGRFSTRKNRISLTRGRAQLLNAPLLFSAEIQNPETASPGFRAEVSGPLDLKDLPTKISELPKELRLSGTLPVKLTFEGKGDRWNGQLESTLEPLGINWPSLLEKKPGQPGDLKLKLSSDRRFSASLNLQLLTWNLEGQYKREKDRDRINLRSSPIDLATLQPLSPLLQEMRTTGRVGANLDLLEKNGVWTVVQGTIELQEVALHAQDIVGDFSEITATASLKNNRLDIPWFKPRWGTDQVQLKVQIPDLNDPKANLHLKTKRLKADSLIFRSPKAILYDLEGQVVASNEGLEFSPVTVRLKGGTRATVTGTVKDFGFPTTKLHVDASYGDIEEVINLFVGPDNKPDTTVSEQSIGPVAVTVNARKGRLGDLRFSNAKGTVTNIKDKVIVEPLTFTTGKGEVRGRVLYDYRGKGHPLLQVSGHAERVDVDRFYQKFFKTKGLATGKLTSDFVLSGRGTGDRFLRTSDGHVHARIEQGVLRQFKTLAKVFSFLNVSQVFKGNLWPDMDKEGMPFNFVEGSFTLKKGILRTENLRVDSEAMNLSVVGDIDLRKETLDMIMGVKPLITVDRVVKRIPIAGWLLSGDEEALVMAHYKITGKQQDPKVEPIPGTSVSKKVLGIFKRVLTLPGKVVTDPGRVFVGPGLEGEDPDPEKDITVPEELEP